MSYKNKKIGFLKYLFQFIGPALFIYIFIKFIDINMFLQTLKKISLEYLLISAVFNLFLHLGKLSRTHYMLRKNEIKVTLFQLAKIYAYSFFVGQMSNIVLSDVTGAGILITRDKEKKLRISNIFIFNRISEMIIISSIFIITFSIHFYLLEPYLQIKYQKIFLIISILFLVTLVVFFFKSKFLALIKDFIVTVKTSFVAITFFTFIIYLSYAISYVHLMKSFNIHLPLSFILLTLSLGSLITVLPVSISGIGTRDISFIALLNLVNVSSEKAVAISSVGFLVLPFLSVSLIYLISLIGLKYENTDNNI